MSRLEEPASAVMVSVAAGSAADRAPAHAAIMEPEPMPHAMARASTLNRPEVENSEASTAKMNVPNRVPITYTPSTPVPSALRSP
nr:hypothetical protein [Brachybacterium epidermidis]